MAIGRKSDSVQISLKTVILPVVASCPEFPKWLGWMCWFWLG